MVMESDTDIVPCFVCMCENMNVHVCHFKFLRSSRILAFVPRTFSLIAHDSKSACQSFSCVIYWDLRFERLTGEISPVEGKLFLLPRKKGLSGGSSSDPCFPLWTM